MDISNRLEETLEKVHLIAAEDTRKTARLLEHLKLSKPLISLEKHNELARVSVIYQAIQNGQDIAVVTDAGTPSISDPGSYLVSQLLDRDVSIIPIPGPSAVTTLISIAGLGGDNYIFGGFFPRKEQQAQTLLSSMSNLSMPIVFFESPKRIVKTFQLLKTHFPLATCVVAKELTKVYEQLFKGNPEEILTVLTPDILKGEWCFVIELPKQKVSLNETFLNTACELKLSQSEISQLTASLGWNKKDVYNYVLYYKKNK
jgi:16S rRNA (cytidine1402-2'-O)-methyltransferase